MMNNYIVYKHTAPNGKVYIGITKQTPEKRWKNGHGYQRNQHFYNAILKYGWNNFSHEIIAEKLTKEQAEEMEVQLISEFGSSENDKGYNIAPGGDATSPVDETKDKISKALSSFWSDDKNRDAMRNSMRGIQRSENARKNISIAQKKRFLNNEERKRISDRQVGRKRAETAKIKTSETLRKFYSDEKNLQAYHKAHEGVNRRLFAKRIKCVETGEVFEAVIDAERKYNVDHRNIVAVCRGKRKHAGGYRWQYIEPVVN